MNFLEEFMEQFPEVPTCTYLDTFRLQDTHLASLLTEA